MRTLRDSAAGVVLCAAGLMLCVGDAGAQTIDPFFDCGYNVTDLGGPPGVPTNLGGVTFLQGNPDVMLIGGAANRNDAAIYAVEVERDAGGRITGFAGTATVHASAPNIDGGLAYGPGGVLFFTRYSMNGLGQIKPGSTEPDKLISLSPLGFSSSVGAMAFVPDGFGGAGRIKLASYNAGRWHDAELTPDGNGTFDISAPTNDILIGGGPEGIVYIPAGSVLFQKDSILVSEYSGGRVAAYEVDGQGDPKPDTRRVFITGLTGAEGGTRDPVTGDFIFSTFGGGNRVIAVRGFDPECPANINGDCSVDIFDVLTFLTWFEAGDLRADFAPPFGVLDVFDVLAYLDIFAQGCP